MAKITTVTLVDDIDGTEADETIEFAYRGKGYKIDLSEGNAKEFDGAVAGFIESATSLGRVVIGGRSVIPTSGRKPSVDKEQNQAIREWARKRGLKVSDRGRIPGEVLDAYHAENG